MLGQSDLKRVRWVENRRDSAAKCAGTGFLSMRFNLVTGFRSLFCAGAMAEHRSDGQLLE